MRPASTRPRVIPEVELQNSTNPFGLSKPNTAVRLSGVDDVISESLAGAKNGAGNITSNFRVNTDEALALGDKLLGQGYKEVGKAGSGVFEKQVGSQTYRFRIDENSLLGKHAPNEPHVHVEILDENRNILVNNHIPLID
ncbi:hypothetical protein [Pelosinus fermentans]|uniref:Uncharacterized protein n=1 Tax=Pelosinus fermentans JBW45 TaxID=1192197 RepID=I9NM86_9FIRM|nr:hypothetical protein [Pelosinus fermentans]AJQ28765.1 hypothetical protein JBW_03424 [Pelosinus fermentans JBW45]